LVNAGLPECKDSARVRVREMVEGLDSSAPLVARD
jgi:hypothetical protein